MKIIKIICGLSSVVSLYAIMDDQVQAVDFALGLKEKQIHQRMERFTGEQRRLLLRKAIEQTENLNLNPPKDLQAFSSLFSPRDRAETVLAGELDEGLRVAEMFHADLPRLRSEFGRLPSALRTKFLNRAR